MVYQFINNYINIRDNYIIRGIIKIKTNDHIGGTSKSIIFYKHVCILFEKLIDKYIYIIPLVPDSY